MHLHRTRVRTYPVILALVGFFVLCGSALAQSPTPPSAVQQGVAWLESQVQPDGSLANEDASLATPFQARAEAALTLDLLGHPSPVLGGSVAGNNATNVEYLARRILAGHTTGGPTTVDVNALLAIQNADGGWGLTESYPSDSLDTALALQALQQARPAASVALQQAVQYLAQAESASGAWGIAGQDSLYFTARVALAAAGHGSDPAVTSIITHANTWLLGQRNASGAFDTVINNAWPLLTVSLQSVHQAARTPLVAALTDAQNANGSWLNDPYVTAVVLRALRAASRPSRDQISVSGHVVDGDTGVPLSDVTASLSGPQTYGQPTDANGDFEFTNIPAGNYTLKLEHAGYGTVQASMSVAPGQNLDFGTIALTPLDPGGGGPTTAAIRGLVTAAATGDPVAGATVSANGTSVPTATDGSYQISGLAPGPVTVSAASAGYQTVTGTGTLVPGGALLFSPQLHTGTTPGNPSATILGVVTAASTGDPIQGATIAVTGANTASATTDASGAYEINGLDPGTVQIAVSASGYDGVQATTQLQGNTWITFSPAMYPIGTMPPGANTSGVTGVVVDSTTGQPLVGVSVLATAPGGTTRTTTTDAAGRFTVTGFTEETATLEFSLADYVSSRFRVWPVPLQTIDIGQVRLRPVGLVQYLPDLTVEAVDSKTQATTNPQTFRLTGTVLATVANRGNDRVHAGVILVAFHDADGNGIYDRSIDIVLGEAMTPADIEPYGNLQVSIPVGGLLPFRDAPVTVWVDRGQSVIELDESNNVGSSSALCRLPGPPSTIDAELKWAWSGSATDKRNVNVFGPVVVGPLTDTNGDGLYDQRDVPTLVFAAGSTITTQGSTVLVAVSGKDGHELWRRDDLDVTNRGSAAIADIDGHGAPEIIISDKYRTKLIALHHDGSLLWAVPTGPTRNRSSFVSDSITVADLNQDGSPEIIQGDHVFDNAGNLLWVGGADYGGIGSSGYGYVPVAADVTPVSDGMEVVAGRTLYGADGHVIWNRSDIPCDGLNAVADFGYPNPPQIVLVSCGTVYLLNRDGSTIWNTALAGGGRGGPPTIGDFGGEGIPQIGVAGAGAYAVYGADGSIRWSSPTSDYSSNVTGSSAFDFLLDGRVEVLYADEQKLRIYDGATGDVLWSIDNRSATTLEYPIVVDVDNDGHADIVSGANWGASYAGVRVFSAANGGWAPTRGIWNQHAYHVTNIRNDGSVPRVEPNSWEHGNTYRLNAFLHHQALDGPDLTAGGLRLVDHGTGQLPALTARIGNGGQIASGTTSVAFYSGDPSQGGTLLGTLAIGAIGPGDYLDVELVNVTGLQSDRPIYVVVDPDDHVEECDNANNSAHIPFGASNPLAQVRVATDAPSYSANTLAQLQGTATNVGRFATEYSLDLRIEDLSGHVVIDFGPQALGTIAGGGSATRQLAWDTGTTLAGPYALHGLLYDVDGDLVAQDRSPFSITAGSMTLISDVAADRQVYSPTDQVVIPSHVINTSSNGVLSDLTLSLAVTDPNGTTVYTVSYPIAQLRPREVKFFESIMPLQQAPEGSYQVTQTVADSTGVILDTRYADFLVDSTAVMGAGLAGQITATPEVVAVGDSVNLHAIVNNSGNSALTALPLAIVIVDPDNQQVLQTLHQTSTLAQGQSVPFDGAWLARGTDGSTYFAVLRATVGSGAARTTITLDYDPFRVKASQLATTPVPLNPWFMTLLAGLVGLLGLVWLRAAGNRRVLVVDHPPRKCGPVADRPDNARPQEGTKS